MHLPVETIYRAPGWRDPMEEVLEFLGASGYRTPTAAELAARQRAALCELVGHAD